MSSLTVEIKDMKISKKRRLSFVGMALIPVVVGAAGLLGMLNLTVSRLDSQERMNALQVVADPQASQETDKIIKVINGLAVQTNIPALNAAVEAVRAGKAGKGFAVLYSSAPQNT